MARFNTNTFRSLNESIARIQNPIAALDEAMEYTSILEAVILDLCEALDLDPQALVEDVMTVAREKEHQKKMNRLGAKSDSGEEKDVDAHKKSVARYHKELASKKVYGKRGKILKRKQDFGFTAKNPYR
jgi:hypothetical protein